MKKTLGWAKKYRHHPYVGAAVTASVVVISLGVWWWFAHRTSAEVTDVTAQATASQRLGLAKNEEAEADAATDVSTRIALLSVAGSDLMQARSYDAAVRVYRKVQAVCDAATSNEMCVPGFYEEIGDALKASGDAAGAKAAYQKQIDYYAAHSSTYAGASDEATRIKGKLK